MSRSRRTRRTRRRRKSHRRGRYMKSRRRRRRRKSRRRRGGVRPRCNNMLSRRWGLQKKQLAGSERKAREQEYQRDLELGRGLGRAVAKARAETKKTP